MGKLAINGGEKLRTKPFTNWPVFDESEIENVTNVVRSGKWFRNIFGEAAELKGQMSEEKNAQVVLFQDEFAKYQNAEYGVACANGTAALEVAIKALGIGPGDEVIVPSYTFVSTATSVLQVNAVPVFVDIDPDTYNIDPTSIEEAITERTKAIIPVHFAGQPADMDRIMEIAKKYGLYVIEDSSHGHGSEWKGKRVGAIGDIGTFSFQGSKNMTSGEGGIMISNNKDFASLCESYIWIGREVDRPWYEFHRLGWNYRMTEFQAAILRAQLGRLDKQIEKRDENVKYFKSQLESFEGLKALKVDTRVTRNSNHIIIVKFDPKEWGIDRNTFVDAMLSEGIAMFKGYAFPLYKNPMFKNKEFFKKGCPLNCQYYNKEIDFESFEKSNPVSEKACLEEAVWFEHRMFLGEKDDIDDIICAIKKIQQNVNELKILK